MKTNHDMGVPSLAICPECKRVMEIRRVTPKFRSATETIDYVCTQCGTTRRQNSARSANEESPPS
jgi:RNase P subunit RPR2